MSLYRNMGLLCALVTSLATFAVACGGQTGTPTQTGQLNAPCYGNGTCDPGLQCVDDLCVTPSGDAPGQDATGGQDSGSSSDTGGPGENLAPVVAITTPEADTVIDQGSAVTLGASVSDDRDPAESFNLRWSSNLQGELGEAPVSASGASTFTIDTLVSGTHTLIAKTTDSEGLEGSAEVTLIVNGPPSAPEVAITPSEPVTTDDLTSEIVEDAVDPNRDSTELDLA